MKNETVDCFRNALKGTENKVIWFACVMKKKLGIDMANLPYNQRIVFVALYLNSFVCFIHIE